MTKDTPLYLVCPAAPYANAPLHMGRVGGSILPADVYARYLRSKNQRVSFIMIIDCHGTPIMKCADEAGISPIEFVNRWSKRIITTVGLWNIQPDKIHSTREPAHHLYVTDQINYLISEGYATKTNEQELACKTCKNIAVGRFVKGTCICGALLNRMECEACLRILEVNEILNPVCRICSTPLSLVKQENYRLNLVKYKANIERHFTSKDYDYRIAEFYNTQNMNVSKTILRYIQWGIDPALIEGTVVYVWIEALYSYLTFTRAYHYEKHVFCHFIGKDNLHFHTVILGHLLLYRNFALPSFLKVRNWYTLDRSKQSASEVHYLDLYELQPNHNPIQSDLFRAYLTSNDTTQKDVDLTIPRFNEFVLRFINTVHNLIYRVHAYHLKKIRNNNIVRRVVDEAFDDAMSKSEHTLAWQIIFRKVSQLNETFHNRRNQFNEVEYYAFLDTLSSLIHDLAPFMPVYSAKWQQLFLSANKGLRLDYIYYQINS